MKKLLLLIFLFAEHQNIFAQYTRYIIQLKDKAGTPFTIADPLQFLTQRAIDRRVRYNIAIDESDLPITPRYIDSIRATVNVTILNYSKWFNQLSILITDPAALSKINSYPFVVSSSPIAARVQIPTPVKLKPDPPNVASLSMAARPQTPSDIYDYGIAYPQVSLHNAEFLHNQGFKGEGMQLAMMDAGFYHYKSLPTFDSIRNNHQILGTWDFVANEESVDEDYVHGMDCLSTI
ncbi:MAG: hypothetical protein ABIQ31_22290, partial [Ferruginibacter sp.]